MTSHAILMSQYTQAITNPEYSWLSQRLSDEAIAECEKEIRLRYEMIKSGLIKIVEREQ